MPLEDNRVNSFYRNKSVLIPGGAGFIGSSLAISLVSLGAQVTLVDSMIPDYGGNLFNIHPIRKKVQLHFTDLRDAYSLPHLVKEQDIIFNLAGTLSHIDSMTKPLIDLDINCKTQLTLLEAVRLYSPKAKIIFAGTRNQYGKAQTLPVDESHPQEPTDINGIHSIAAEKYHLMYHGVYGLQTVSLRMTNTFGPRHQMRHARQGVLNWFIRQALADETITLYGTGSQIRDTNYIDDVVSALLLVGASTNGYGQAYNLGGTPVSLAEFVSEVLRIVGKGRKKTIPFPADRAQIEVGDYIASIEKIKKTFGWEPKTTLKSAIKKTAAYYQRYKQQYW